MINKTDIPSELRRHPHWVLWKAEERKGHICKAPYSAKTKRKASVVNPDDWTDFETAVEVLAQGGFDGVGIVLTKECGIVAIDIDHCRDDGRWNDIAMNILNIQPTYAELSPSGTGCHLFFRGTKPGERCKNPENGVEMYADSRYITVTGNKLPNAPCSVADGQKALETVYGKYFDVITGANTVGGLTPKTDEEIFDELMTGKWQRCYADQSKADFRLCCILARKYKDDVKIDEVFRKSGLFRAKWDEMHGSETYGQRTIRKAMEAVASDSEGNRKKGVADVESRRGLIIQKEGCLYRQKGDNSSKITNFLVKPIRIVRNEDEAILEVLLISNTHREKKYRVATSDFSSTSKFKAVLNRNSLDFSFFGTDGDLELLKTYIAGMEIPATRGVRAMGMYRGELGNLFATDDGSIDADGICSQEIVQIEKYKNISSGITNCNPLAREKLVPLIAALLSFNEVLKTVSILAWVAACFVKEQMRWCGIKFPHLFLIGEAGSGKSTTLERVIMQIFSAGKAIAATQMTSFALMMASASSNTIPLFIDEFKPSKMDDSKLKLLCNHMRDAYDGHMGERGKPDQSVTRYELLAPIVVAGEESPAEPAIRERSIELLHMKSSINNVSAKAAYKTLVGEADALRSFGCTLLKEALTVTQQQCKDWHAEGVAMMNTELAHRVINNLACCYVGLKLLERVCIKYGYAWSEVFQWSMEQCVEYLQDAAIHYLLGGKTNNESIVEETLSVMSRVQDICEWCIYDGENKVLWVPLSAVYDKYTQYRKNYAVACECVPYKQFLNMLKHSDLLVSSSIQKTIHGRNLRCVGIDYGKLSRRCDVDGFLDGAARLEPSKWSVIDTPGNAPTTFDGQQDFKAMVDAWELENA